MCSAGPSSGVLRATPRSLERKAGSPPIRRKTSPSSAGLRGSQLRTADGRIAGSGDPSALADATTAPQARAWRVSTAVVLDGAEGDQHAVDVREQSGKLARLERPEQPQNESRHRLGGSAQGAREAVVDHATEHGQLDGSETGAAQRVEHGLEAGGGPELTDCRQVQRPALGGCGARARRRHGRLYQGASGDDVPPHAARRRGGALRGDLGRRLDRVLELGGQLLEVLDVDYRDRSVPAGRPNGPGGASVEIEQVHHVGLEVGHDLLEQPLEVLFVRGRAGVRRPPAREPVDRYAAPRLEVGARRRGRRTGTAGGNRDDLARIDQAGGECLGHPVRQVGALRRIGGSD